jgi:hypothetical protein
MNADKIGITHIGFKNSQIRRCYFILQRARAKSRRRRITATCQHAQTDDTERHAWPVLTSISLQGQALPVHKFLFPTSHNSIVTLSQFSWWPSARRAHFIVTFMRFTLIGADLGDYDSALSWDSGRRSASPPCRFANESTNTWDPVREAPMYLTRLERLLWDSVRKPVCVWVLSECVCLHIGQH